MKHISTDFAVSLADQDVGIIGAACRLPGAADESAFERLLVEGRSAVQTGPTGRWARERFYHPRTTEPGFSYTFAGGYLDDPFGFDATVFGLSPREASQIDPQQRLLLEVVWEALEDARIPPSSLGGKDVGVYVGASSLDHGNLHAQDLASIDSHFMTGNTLSIVSNRISYAFDLRGPSFTVDTACSSSLVAFNQALGDLRLGRVHMAIVAGVNLLFSPASFVGFSRAGMLSPSGLCRPFSADGDGYVRSEGAVAIVLQRASHALPGSIRAYAVAAGVNSDGRTSGIALPGLDGQKLLLDRLYGEAGIHPDMLSFVEAHGTGTRVGDPIEARAIGSALGQRRHQPLPIGSVKSNIGHLEPASGVAGLMKALIALKSRRLPKSLHLDSLNPLIDFADLNLAPAIDAVPLEPRGVLTCGVSSFGFGGTNAHVILRSAPDIVPVAMEAPLPQAYLMLSAASREALGAMARTYAHAFEAGADASKWATETAHGRDTLKHRLVVAVSKADRMVRQLTDFAAHGTADRVAVGSAAGIRVPVAFVYSGNGVQWVGMGRTAFRRNQAFRDRFTEIDQTFTQATGQSLIENLFATDLADRLKSTAVVQPLIFAIQSAITFGLAEAGLRPDVVIGHSVGELAAALSAGAIGLTDAIRVIEARAACQQELHGAGLMAVFAADRLTMDGFVGSLGRDDIEIACENGPSSITLSGSQEAIRLAARLGRKQRLASRILDFEYPFHSHLLEPLRQRFLDLVGTLAPVTPDVAMISTVTAARIDTHALDARYWWENIRRPVRFREGVETAITEGVGLFVEIGPKPILVGPITETIKGLAAQAHVIGSLAESDEREAHEDPIAFIAARALSHGALLGQDKRSAGVHPNVDRAVKLPFYPWQRKTYRFSGTSEGLDLLGQAVRHPLIGGRIADGQPEWRTLLDAHVVPYLADHVVDGEIVVPGSALAEMALAAARDLTPDGPIGFEDFDILQPLTLSMTAMREMSVRHAETTGAIEIWSRPRLGANAWTMHARGRLVTVARLARPSRDMGPVISESLGDSIYVKASQSGIDYGPAFRRIVSLKRNVDNMDLLLAPSSPDTGAFTQAQILDPTSVDAALHGLFDQIKLDGRAKRTYVPVRFGTVVVFRDHAEIVRAELSVIRETDHSVLVFVALFDRTGAVVAELDQVLLRAVVMARQEPGPIFYHVTEHDNRRVSERTDFGPLITTALEQATIAPFSDGWLMLRAHMRATAHASLTRLSDGSCRVDLAQLQLTGRISPQAAAFARMLVDDLVMAGIATIDDDGILLAPDSGLPDPDAILLTVAAEIPGASGELRLAALVAAELDGFLTTGTAVKLPAAAAEQFEIEAQVFAASQASVAAILDAAIVAGKDHTPEVLLLEPNCRGLLRQLLASARDGRIRLTLAGLDQNRLAHLSNGQQDGEHVHTLDLSATEGGTRGGFDLAIVASHQLDVTAIDLLKKAGLHMASNGRLVAVQPPSDHLIDFYFGSDPAWFARSLGADAPIGQCATRGETETLISRAGWTDITCRTVADGAAHIILATPQIRAAQSLPGTPVLISCGAESGASGLIAATSAAIRAIGGRVISEPIVLSGSFDRFELIEIIDPGAGDDLERTERSLAEVRGALARAASAPEKFRLWLAVRGSPDRQVDPVADAIAGFARVAINEYTKLDIRIVMLDRALDEPEVARRLAALIAAPDDERELSLAPDLTSMHRVRSGLPVSRSRTPVRALTLDFPRRGMLEHFDWLPKDRRVPLNQEIEIAVIATGLNFRDVMLAMGLLADDVLDDGMAGAVFGFECVGRVIAVGSDTKRHAIDDIVAGFAPNAFSTHVTAAEGMFIPLPAGLQPEAAATVPVAFLTAWYALVELARLKRGERVLIHGAAGGVGLAAMQIARARGAEIIATVSSPDKRALVQLFGAARVYDSRTGSFAEAILRDIGGVDVVLNSLSGDAMRAGLKCLKPFGRFVELGKRDYVANTELGLRPFRRNLTYFGVDLDQLLSQSPDLIAKGLKYVAAGLSVGRFTALPYRAFDGEDIGTAFRLMQSAGHVGKIIVRPKAIAEAPIGIAPASPSAQLNFDDGVQLVVGGTGGFGLATAFWLADNGARRIVVASRRGLIDSEAQGKVAALVAKGVLFAAECVDVTDARDVETLVARIAARYGAISGVFHSAMVLDDGLIADIEPHRLHKVLAPKIAGASNLDRATRGQPVKRFVLYSSATTLVGNPGQGAYVAANAYVEGLARARLADGLPALSVAWGAIADAGVLARNAALSAKLQRLTGVVAMPAAEALDALGQLLAAADTLTVPNVVVARFQFAKSAIELPILATPAFKGVFAPQGPGSGHGDTTLANLIAGKSEADQRRLVTGVIVGEVARILRLPVKDVDVERPLSELGMDSLMALELRMCLEAKFAIDLPLVAITSVNSARDLAGRVLQSLATSETPPEAQSEANRALVELHGGDEATFNALQDSIAAAKVRTERVI